MLNLREDIVIEELQHDSHNDTEDGGNQRHLHTCSNNGRTDVTSRLDTVESHHHTNHRSQESQRGGNGNEQANPRTAFLHFRDLYSTKVRQLTVNLLQGFLDVQQSLITDGSHRAACIATEVLSPFRIVLLQLGIHITHQFLGIHLRQRQIDDALNAESQSQYQRKSHQRHKSCRALNKLPFQLFVESATLFCRLCIRFAQFRFQSGHHGVCRKGRRVFRSPHLCRILRILVLCLHLLNTSQQTNYCQ